MARTTTMPRIANAPGGPAPPDVTLTMPVTVLQSEPAAPPGQGLPFKVPRKWPKRVFRALVVLVLASVAYYGFNLYLVMRTARADQARAVDVILVLGAAQYNGVPSPQLEARLDHTVELWQQGLADVVFVTGGNQPGDQFTEAGASAFYLVEHGVDPAAIQMEDTGHSTWESMANFTEIADEQGWDRVLIVTDPFHSLRARLTAQELGFTAYTSPTRTSPVQGGEEFLKELKEAAGVSVGRIIGFERLWELTG